MRALLDVNVLVALFDPAHLNHDAAHAWFAAHAEPGWASCPLSENGLVRVISNPAYPGSRTTTLDALERLASFQRAGRWEFWPDDISLVEAGLLDGSRPLVHHQLTDIYLLALAVHHGGRLATFDRRIPQGFVRGAEPRHLVVIEP